MLTNPFWQIVHGQCPCTRTIHEQSLFRAFWWTLVVVPKFVNIVHQTPFFALSREHCSRIVCQSSWTRFTKPSFWTFWWTLFVDSLPKFVKSVHQTPLLHFVVNNAREHFAKVREQCSPSLARHKVWWTVFTNNDHVIDHQGVHALFDDHVTL